MTSISSLKEAAQQFGTPLYCFDGDKLEKRIAFLRSCLPSNVQLCYAAKANTFVLPMMESWIDHYEICSPGEYAICKRIHIPNQKIVLSGVYKKKEDLEAIFASSEENPVITIESMEHFQMVQELTRKYQKYTKILLRLTSGNQFGLDLDILKQLIQVQDQHPLLNYIGIQYFSGTQKYSQRKVLREIEYLEIVLQELQEIHYKPSIVEYGPGFPVDYFQTMPYQEKEHFDFFSKELSRFKDVTIILELGRSIVAHCGSYITKVVDKKTNKGQNYLIVDGGIHHLVYYGQGIAMKLPPFIFVPSHKSTTEKPWNICGSLCTVNDILMKQVLLQEPEIGDYFIFKNTGAYCPTEGISLFLTRDLPAVCALYKGQKYQLRDHKSTVDLNAPNLYEKGE